MHSISRDVSAVFKKQDLIGTFDFSPRSSPLKMPNLVPHGMHYLIVWNATLQRYQADVEVEVENINNVGAFEFNVNVVLIAIGRVPQASANTSVTLPGLTARSSGLIACGSQRLALGTIDLPQFDRNFDLDIAAMISVDSPTTSLARGEVFETIEADNTLTKTCRIYGLDHPDTSQRPCN